MNTHLSKLLNRKAFSVLILLIALLAAASSGPLLSAPKKEMALPAEQTLQEMEKLAIELNCRRATTFAEQARNYSRMFQQGEAGKKQTETFFELSWAYFRKCQQELTEWKNKRANLEKFCSRLEKDMALLEKDDQVSLQSLGRFRNYLNSSRSRMELGELGIAEHLLKNAEEAMARYSKNLRVLSSARRQAMDLLSETLALREKCSGEMKGLRLRRAQLPFDQATMLLSDAQEALNADEFEKASRKTDEAADLLKKTIKILELAPAAERRTAQLLWSVTERMRTMEEQDAATLTSAISEIEFLMDSGKLDQAYRQVSELYSILTLKTPQLKIKTAETRNQTPISAETEKLVSSLENLKARSASGGGSDDSARILKRIADECGKMVEELYKLEKQQDQQAAGQILDRYRIKLDTMTRLFDRAMNQSTGN